MYLAHLPGPQGNVITELSLVSPWNVGIAAEVAPGVKAGVRAGIEAGFFLWSYCVLFSL